LHGPDYLGHRDNYAETACLIRSTPVFARRPGPAGGTGTGSAGMHTAGSRAPGEPEMRSDRKPVSRPCPPDAAMTCDDRPSGTLYGRTGPGDEHMP
jgi:hypothetical protein